MAYGVEHYRISGAPSWALSAAYDVEAKPAGPVDRAQALLMLQALLADRFGLRVHHENTDLPGYSLVVEKDGAKLNQSDALKSDLEWVPGRMFGPGSMAELARLLKGPLGHPVEDRTNLAGRYAIDFRWNPATQAVPVSSPDDGGLLNASEPQATLLGALKRLGLGVRPTKIQVDMIVIDQLARPSEN